MLARDIIGKTVARVAQRTFWNNRTGQNWPDVEYIEFTDGTRIYPRVTATEYDNLVDFGVHRPPRKEKPRAQ